MADSRPDGRPVRTNFERWQLAVAVVPFLVAVAYAGLRFAYGSFYDQLGVAPEEVGLGQIELLVRSFGLVVVVAILFGVFVALVVVPLLALTGATVGVAATDWMLRELPWWALLPLALVPLALFLLTHGLVIAGLVCVLAVIVYVGAIGGYARGRGNDLPTGRALAAVLLSWMSRWGRPVALVSGALSLALVFALTLSLASTTGALVREGWAERDWAVPWRADPATVYWIGPSPALDPVGGRCLMYLGQANSILVLYDVTARRSVRVPASQVLLAVDPATERCQPGH
jgi:hypothetical protein